MSEKALLWSGKQKESLFQEKRPSLILFSQRIHQGHGAFREDPQERKMKEEGGSLGGRVGWRGGERFSV